ncbi:MFS transporter [Gordonia soli]|uniref:Putative drug resistance transporter n=1 Tax=Gordonia soli NBRC 108243 TaxID=1223545 RepID=M0QD57_9ACTN|nr:MFS transporter [Gordonia soli]GAC66500.1 putative drug resistance transporter [Gordonia soli NBRC 108243]
MTELSHRAGRPEADPGPNASHPAHNDIDSMDRRTWIGLAVVVASQLMIILDGTIVTVALPRIRDDLGFSEVSQSWVMNAYVLAVGGLLLLGGRLGDLIGRRRALLYGIAVFTAASLLGGLAVNAQMLLAARILQGVGAALAAPTALGLIVANFPAGPARSRAISWFSLGAASGGAIGLLLGGVLTEQLSWHWVMLVNVPIGLAILALAPLTVDETDRQRGHLGIADTVLSATGVSAVVYGFIRASEQSWSDPATLVSLTVGVIALAGFTIRQRRSTHPLLPPRLVNTLPKVAPYLVMLLLPGAMMGMFTFTTLHLQDVLRYSVIASGFAFLPFMALNIGLTVSGVTARLVARFGAARILLVGLFLAIVGLLWLSRIGPDSSFLVDILAPSMVMGAGIGLSIVPANVLVVDNSPEADTGAASGLMQALLQVGGALGLATLMTVFGPLQREDPSGTATGTTILVASAFAGVAFVALAIATFRVARRP